MANTHHISILRGGVSNWNKWREDNPNISIDLSNAHFGEIDLRGANLSYVNLCGVDFHSVIFTDHGIYESTAQTQRQSFRANLQGAKMCGVDLHGVDLSEADLNCADLSYANLVGSDLRSANLSEADLSSATLTGADLRRANLYHASLYKADLSSASLIGSDLSGTILIRSNLLSANLTNADLSNAKFLETILANVDLTNTHGLELCSHAGPSIIDHRTLERSSGINTKFLQGVGLPDFLIESAFSLYREHNKYFSCFISYSNEDKKFADRLYTDLQNQGVRCWFASEDIQAGRKIEEQIDLAIRYHEKLLLILSGSSINSEWVKTELHKARLLEKQKRRSILFPIKIVDYAVIEKWECFDADIGKDSAQEIREYFIRDFSHWEDSEKYMIELDKLLKDLER